MADGFIPVILCGGGGSRLWPASRGGLAKPYIRLPGMQHSLLAQTYARLRQTDMPQAVITIAAAADLFLCRAEAAAHAPDIPHFFIGEPAARNTAAAVIAAATFAARRFGEDTVLLALPADHLVGRADIFWAAAARAADAAAGGRFALLGVAPDYPATGYGYIECGAEEYEKCHVVRRFVEKPDARRAAEFCAAGGFLWNAGIFCMTPKTLFSELPAAAPQLCAPAEALQKTAPARGDWLPSMAEYSDFPNISFDYAVMENTGNAVAAEIRGAQWSDAGTWRAVAETLPADARGNRSEGETELLDCDNCFIAGGGRLVAGINLSGLHIIDSPDALLVSAAESAERVREIYARLQKKSDPRAAEPNTARRPWGSYTVLSEGAGYKVKRIEVNPGGRLSLQSHRRRSENWTAVLGEMGVVIEEREFFLRPGESCAVPINAKHRMFNGGETAAAVIEVQTGEYLGEDDIIRYEDIYGRA